MLPTSTECYRLTSNVVNMAENSNVEDFEYVTQLFGFTPKAFADGIYNAINDYIKEFFREMGKILDEEFAKGDGILSTKIRDGCKDLIAKCYKNVDRSLDKMEVYLLKNIFVIPAPVLLPEDEVHSLVRSADQVSLADVDKEISELKTDIHKTIMYRKLLHNEQAKFQKILVELKRLEEWFDKVCCEVNACGLKEALDLISANTVAIMNLLETQKQINN